MLLDLGPHGVARTGDLLAAGATETSLRRELVAGRLRRVRKGWLATVDADASIVEAVRRGAALGCVSALRTHGVWVPEHDEMHLSAHPHAGRVDGAGCIVHRRRAVRSSTPVETLTEAVRQVLRCRPTEEAIAVIDSCLHTRGMRAGAVAALFDERPARLGHIRGEIDGSAESGYESLVRVRLRRLGLHVSTQVQVAGVGRVDMIIGNKLVIEVDGQAWHEGPRAFLVDRGRDLALASLGMRSLRLAPRHIVHEWRWTSRAILAAAADARRGAAIGSGG